MYRYSLLPTAIKLQLDLTWIDVHVHSDLDRYMSEYESYQRHSVQRNVIYDHRYIYYRRYEVSPRVQFILKTTFCTDKSMEGAQTIQSLQLWCYAVILGVIQQENAVQMVNVELIAQLRHQRKTTTWISLLLQVGRREQIEEDVRSLPFKLISV